MESGIFLVAVQLLAGNFASNPSLAQPSVFLTGFAGTSCWSGSQSEKRVEIVYTPFVSEMLSYAHPQPRIAEDYLKMHSITAEVIPIL